MNAQANTEKTWADMIEEAECTEAQQQPARKDVVTYDQAPEKETDPHRLAQRQKQIDYGKNTLGYQNYIASVPKAKRDKFTHPSTPDINNPVGKRQWDGLVKAWRRKLHAWDTSEGQEAVVLAPTTNCAAAAAADAEASGAAAQPAPAARGKDSKDGAAAAGAGRRDRRDNQQNVPSQQRAQQQGRGSRQQQQQGSQRQGARLTSRKGARRPAAGSSPEARPLQPPEQQQQQQQAAAGHRMPLPCRSGSASGKKRVFESAFDTASSGPPSRAQHREGGPGRLSQAAAVQQEEEEREQQEEAGGAEAMAVSGAGAGGEDSLMDGSPWEKVEVGAAAGVEEEEDDWQNVL